MTLVRLSGMSAVALVITACNSRNRQLCWPVPSPNVDSAYASAAPLRLYPDSSAPPDSVVGVVLRAGPRSPVASAEVRFRPDTAAVTRTDSTGRFALSAPHSSRTVIQTRALGYLGRRDTLETPKLRHQRLEVVLLDAYTFGDIQPMVCGQATKPSESP